MALLALFVMLLSLLIIANHVLGFIAASLEVLMGVALPFYIMLSSEQQ